MTGIMRWIVLVVGGLIIGMWAGSPTGNAQKKGKKKPAVVKPVAKKKAKPDLKKAAADERAERRRSGTGARKVVIKEAEKIIGRVRKPEVEYILQRSAVDYKGLILNTKMTTKIVESVKSPPF